MCAFINPAVLDQVTEVFLDPEKEFEILPTPTPPPHTAQPPPPPPYPSRSMLSVYSSGKLVLTPCTDGNPHRDVRIYGLIDD